MTSLLRRHLSRAKTLGLLNELETCPDDKTGSLYLTPQHNAEEIRILLQKMNIEKDVSKEIVETADRSQTGAVIFSSAERTELILPPFPIRETCSRDSIDAEELRKLLERDYRIALVLVRLGSYAVGICQGETLVSSKVGTGLVHGRHKKGGSSAHRFERHRDKQIEYFLTRVCQRAREQLEPHIKSLDYLVYGGARTTIQLLEKQCTFIGKLKTETLPPLFDIPEPRLRVLEAAVNSVWSSTVIEWQEN